MVDSRIATCLWYDGKAEEAARFYVSLIPNSEVTSVFRPDPAGPALLVEFHLDGVPYQALNGGPQYRLSECVSISVTTKDQAETDRLWAALTAGGGEEWRCAWLKDRFGLSWQVVPEALLRYLKAEDRAASARAMQAMMGMKKIDIAALDRAFEGD